MNLPGLLIEYLITGVVSILGGWWLISLISPESAIGLADLNAGHAAIGGPIAYVIGMCVDYLSRRLTDTLELILDVVASRRSKLFSRRRGEQPTQPAEVSNPVVLLTKAAIAARSSELGRQLEIRKSRDRIARGVFANAVFLAAAGIMAGTKLPIERWTWLIASLAIVFITYKIWRRMEGLSHRYRVLASEALLGNEREALLVPPVYSAQLPPGARIPIATTTDSGPSLPQQPAQLDRPPLS